MRIVLFAIVVFLSGSLFSQDSTRIFLAAGTRLSDVPLSKIYRFSDFKAGKVLFYDNQSNTSLFNYNLINGEIMFIAGNGDTLAIAKDQMLNIKRVTIDTSSFVYNKGYMEIIRENKSGALAKKQQYFLVSRSKIGGYNQENPTSSIDSYTSFIDRQNNPHNLVVRENISLQLKNYYYVGDPYKTFLIINKRNLDKIFFKKRTVIGSYLKEHTVDFNNEKDVTALFIFLTETSPD